MAWVLRVSPGIASEAEGVGAAEEFRDVSECVVGYVHPLDLATYMR